jgi:hypothetical protein
MHRSLNTLSLRLFIIYIPDKVMRHTTCMNTYSVADLHMSLCYHELSQMLTCIKTLTSHSANTPLETEEQHASWGHTSMAGKLSKQGYTNFPKIPQSSQNSRCQKDNIQHVSHRGSTNIRCHGTKVSCPGDLVPAI